MNTLFLTLKGCYFDEIALGTKTVEYRDLTAFFKTRLEKNGQLIKYDAILFQNGYNKNSRRMLVEHLGTEITDCYELNIGQIIKPPYIEVDGVTKIVPIVVKPKLPKKHKSFIDSIKTHSM